MEGIGVLTGKFWLRGQENDSYNLPINFCSVPRLASQAVKEVSSPGIDVSAIQLKTQIIIQVADNGHGIPVEISDEIFMPFFTTREKGSGVGLSYSRQVMNMNGGRIEFNSQPGHTVFRLVF